MADVNQTYENEKTHVQGVQTSEIIAFSSLNMQIPDVYVVIIV